MIVCAVAMDWRLAVLLITRALYELVSAQQDPIPSFTTVGTQYPNLDEDEQCRPIKLRLIRHSARFTATLVRNSTNNEISYDNEDARLMTSRLKFRLDLLAEWYFNNYNAKLKVFLAYAEPTVVTDRSNSLHYEGIQLCMYSSYMYIRPLFVGIMFFISRPHLF